MTTKLIEVQVLGKHFNFNVPDNIKTEDFLEIIDFVENRYSRVKKEVGEMDMFRLGLLTSINITEEFFSIKKENERLRAVLNKIDRMIPPIEPGGVQVPIRFSS